jgi:hypothetical protein
VTAIVLLAVLVLIAVAIYIALRTKTSASEEPKDHQTEDFSDSVLSQYPGSDAFEKHIAPHTNKYFNTKIAGASFPSADGSSRPSIIKKCEPMEVLRLELEPNNPVDPNAIAVKRVDGSQLGLPGKQGSERASSRCRQADELVRHL